VVISPAQYRLLSRLSLLQERSQASYVRRLLDLATPSLQAILEPLERATAEEEAFDRDFQEQIDRELDDADEELRNQLSMFDPLELADALAAAPAQSEAMEDVAPKRPLPKAANS
jgi:hypothetical protein